MNVKIQKAMAIIQFKVEGQLIDEYPEFGLADRKLLYKIDYEKGTVIVDGGRVARRDLDYEEIKELPFIRTAMEENVKDITEGKSILDQAEEDE